MPVTTGDVGCQENVTDPNLTGADTSGRQNGGFFSLPKPIELALWNGVNPLNGEQIGPQTGDVRTFKNMDQFIEAVKAQIEYAVFVNVTGNNVSDYIFSVYYPSVFHNMMHPGPRNSGIDFLNGGAKYNWTGGLGVGIGTAGDSLSAIDTLVFRDKAATWEQLLSALKNDWKGSEQLRKKCVLMLRSTAVMTNMLTAGRNGSWIYGLASWRSILQDTADILSVV